MGLEEPTTDSTAPASEPLGKESEPDAEEFFFGDTLDAES
jgi:hypothetical protein